MAKVLPFLHSTALFLVACPLYAEAPAPSDPAAYPPSGSPSVPVDTQLAPAPATGPADNASASAIPAALEPPKPAASEPSRWPELSLRIDPLNWLLQGRLGFELEAEVWRFISVETIPIFVVDEQPPLLALRGIPDTLHQRSNGFGALAGASLGVGFWLDGKPFRGNVLRFYYTNYGLKYSAQNSNGVFDQVRHTERMLVGMFGSHSKWGPFTIATGIGLGVDMNRERRCVVDPSGTLGTKDCSDDEILIQVEENADSYVSVTSSTHPVYLLGRLSLGFVF